MTDEGYLAPRLYIDNDSDMGYYASLVEETQGDIGYYVSIGSVKSNPETVIIVPPDEPEEEIIAYKYTFSFTGVVYLASTLAVNAHVYSDAGLNQDIGTITFYGTFTADKYSITNNSGFSTFYVPSGTTLKAGTKLYSNAACTNQIGTIGTKGTETTAASYKYKVVSSIANIMGNNLYHFKDGVIFYTKQKLPTSAKSDLSIAIYSDSACTKRNGLAITYGGGASTGRTLVKATVTACVNDTPMYKIQLNTNAGNYGSFSQCSYQSKISGTTSTYYTISGSSNKCTVTKTGTASATVVRVNNGSNETFTYNGITT